MLASQPASRLRGSYLRRYRRYTPGEVTLFARLATPSGRSNVIDISEAGLQLIRETDLEPKYLEGILVFDSLFFPTAELPFVAEVVWRSARAIGGRFIEMTEEQELRLRELLQHL